MSPNQRIRTTPVTARDESFRVVQVAGNLFVCSRANGSCCCGWEEKGRMPFDNSLWAEEWERRGIRSKLHLTFTGCLGPCITGNNALLQIHGESIWLKDLNSADVVPAVFDYIDAVLDAGNVLPPPSELVGHVFMRFPPAPNSAARLLPAIDQSVDDDGLEWLDPVCLMDVDPANARHSTEYNGPGLRLLRPLVPQAIPGRPGVVPHPTWALMPNRSPP